MSQQTRIVQPERIRDSRTGEEAHVIYHLPDGPPDKAVEFAPVRCGGDIVLPGPTEKVSRSEVCPDCLSGTKTL
jgi:hypothetical protein